MRVNFLLDFNLIIEELKDFEQVKKVLKYPYYFYKTFPQLENKSSEEIVNHFKINKKVILEKLRKMRKEIRELWKSVEKRFFSDIVNLTNFEWKFQNYKCFLSCAWAGRYFYPKNEIEIFGFLKQIDTLNTLGEELFHLHFWNILEEKFKVNVKFLNSEKYTEKEKKLWFLSEAVVGFVLPEIGFYKRSLWFIPWWKSDTEIKRIYYNLKPLWKNRNNFMDFLERSIRVIT
ncbi:MAG: hypothetical protein B6U88_00840 [Candidatus Aenigmarchaeota archaeon ex4484_56]|nr:MAG: hypothetical protein B6U88_00840 [Candidatus Aenigmarchaeota archaeon ex4484_56]